MPPQSSSPIVKRDKFILNLILCIILLVISIVLTILVGIKGVIWKDYTDDDWLFVNLSKIKQSNVPLYRLSVLAIIGICILWAGTIATGLNSLRWGLAWKNTKINIKL